MINRRIHAIQSEQGQYQREIKLAQGQLKEVKEQPHRLFHHSKKATKLMLTESELNILSNSIQDKNKCVIL